MLKVKLLWVNGYDESQGFREGDIIEGTLDGKIFICNERDDHFFFPEQYEICVAQKDELVLVKDGEDHDWEARYFSHIEGDKIFCFKYSFTSEKTQETEAWAVMQRIKFID